MELRRRPRHVPLIAATAALTVLLLAIPAVGAAASGGDATAEAGIRDTILTDPPTHALKAASAVWGGTYTTSSGEHVRVLSSSSYPQDEAKNQQWAEFLSRLVHGSELATVTLVLSPYREVQSVCGRSAVACYGDNTIYASADQVEDGISAESVIAHEYGHHVAAARSNAPWAAVDWGTKRWASYMNVCSNAQAGQFFPGDERAAYQLNPGEAFAEVFRVLNERHLGMVESPWSIVDRRFYPDATALADVAQDVLSPWTAAGAASFSGRVAKRAVRSVAVATTLDGRLSATVRTNARVRAELVVAGRVVSAKTGRALTLSTTVCGSRTATVRIRNAAKATRYTVSVSRP